MSTIIYAYLIDLELAHRPYKYKLIKLYNMIEYHVFEAKYASNKVHHHSMYIPRHN